MLRASGESAAFEHIADELLRERMQGNSDQ